MVHPSHQCAALARRHATIQPTRPPTALKVTAGALTVAATVGTDHGWSVPLPPQKAGVAFGTGIVTFRLNFHHFDRFELDLRGHIHVRGAAFSWLRLKLANIVLI